MPWKAQWNLYKVDTMAKVTALGDVVSIEISSNNQKSSEVNMKFTICHDFSIPDLLERPKYGKIKENANFFHSKIFKQDSLH